MSVKLLDEHHLGFLSLKGGCTGLSESTLVKMPHCWKSRVTAQIILLSLIPILPAANRSKRSFNFRSLLLINQTKSDYSFILQFASVSQKFQFILSEWFIFVTLDRTFEHLRKMPMSATKTMPAYTGCPLSTRQPNAINGILLTGR